MMPLHCFRFFLLFLFVFSLTVFAGKDEKEIRWDEAASEVDSFPFSKQFVDSVISRHKVEQPQLHLRSMKQLVTCPAETLVYTVGWGPFNAGYVVLTTRYNKETGTVTLGGKALSNNFISAFYRMRDYVISTMDEKGLYPLFFEQHLREGKKYKSNEYILFDNIAGKVHVQSRKKFKTVEAPKFTYDYLSVLHLLRFARAIAPGDTFSEKLFIHSKVHSIRFSVKTSKPKKVEAGTFPCILLKPKLAGEGRAFNKRDKLEIWLSDDKRRIPVAIRSKIKFGAINARLIWYSRTDCDGKQATEQATEQAAEQAADQNTEQDTEQDTDQDTDQNTDQNTEKSTE